MGENNNSIRPFFEPRSVAVIGASRTPGKAGHNIIENLLRLGYKGKIFPVNPQATGILGVPVYPDLEHVPEPPELALIVLPPSLVLPGIIECASRGVRAVIIETAGFGEMNEAGAGIEKEIKMAAKSAGMRVMGPNSIGTINPSVNFNASFARLNRMFLPREAIRPGPTGFIGQTGLLTGVFLPYINSEMGISKVACLGNKCDVDESDMLEYLGDDPSTRVICMYLESIKDGRRFLGLSKRITREKPVIMLKSARTESGARVSATHTGSIAGEDRVYEAAFRQSGIIRVGSFEQLFDVTKAFVHSPLPGGNRIAIISLTGAGCVTAVDACDKHGLRIAELAPATVSKIQPVYPEWWQVRSPLDVWTAVEASGFGVTYATITRAALQDDGVDAAVVLMGATDWVPGKSVAEFFKDIKKEFPDKPLIAVNPLGERNVYQQMNQDFLALGIPTYTGAEDAIEAIAALWRYREYRREPF